MTARPARLLSIAGSDSSGGAGIQADLATFVAHGAFGMTAVTAVTAQNTLGVFAVELVSPEVVGAEIDAVFADPGVDAVKIGMLGSAAIVDCVATRLASRPGVPVVLDTVLASTTGTPLLEESGIDALRDRLFPRATLVTPNLPEAERLTGRRATGRGEREDLVRRLGEFASAVLLKGAHAEGDEIVDLLWDGRELHPYAHRRIEARNTHGTGCVLSSAIAARLARGEAIHLAVGGAIDFVVRAIAEARPLGAGSGPVHPSWPFEKGVHA